VASLVLNATLLFVAVKLLTPFLEEPLGKARRWDPTFVFHLQPFEPPEEGGGQGGGEGGGVLNMAPLPNLPGRPVMVPDQAAPETVAVTVPPVSPAADSASAGGTGLPGSSWGSGGTGWGTGRGSGVGLGRPGATPAGYTPPRPLLEVFPSFPESKRKSKIRGMVEVKMKVDETGKVVEVTVNQNTTGSEACAQAALEAASRCRFVPASSEFGPVAVWVIKQYRFGAGE